LPASVVEDSAVEISEDFVAVVVVAGLEPVQLRMSSSVKSLLTISNEHLRAPVSWQSQSLLRLLKSAYVTELERPVVAQTARQKFKSGVESEVTVGLIKEQPAS